MPLRTPSGDHGSPRFPPSNTQTGGWTATPAPACREEKSKAMAAGESGLPKRGQTGVKDGREGATLRTQECLLWLIQEGALFFKKTLCTTKAASFYRPKRGWDGSSSSIPTSMNGAGHDRVPQVHHPNAIGPTCPTSRVSQPHGAAESLNHQDVTGKWRESWKSERRLQDQYRTTTKRPKSNHHGGKHKWRFAQD